MHHALKLRPVNQVECVLFARKHFEGHAARGRHHSRGFFQRKAAFRNGFEREVNQNPQTPNAPAFFVDFYLGGRKFHAFKHGFHVLVCGSSLNYYGWGMGGAQ
jgi:hypothetical protein